jgi:hypothetical protein
VRFEGNISHGRRLAIAALLLTLITGLLTVPAFQGRTQVGFNKKQQSRTSPW